MRTVRAVVEARIQGDGDPRETVQKMLEEGSPDLLVTSTIEASGEVSPSHTHLEAAGDSFVALLLQHFPTMTTDQDVGTDVVVLIADILGTVVAQYLVGDTEEGAVESLKVVTDRVYSSALSSTEKLRVDINKRMN